VDEELKEKILKYLGTVRQAKNKDVARALGVEKALVDKAIGELAKEDKLEYLGYGGVTYIAIKGKSGT
jgi:Mn-dependent DtxR family transcriptional regulator